MTKGIRDFTNARFAIGLGALLAAEVTNAQFRAGVMADVQKEFGVSVASSATHYNHAFKLAKSMGADTGNLGRAEDKKGGRKPIHVVDVIKVKTGEVVAAGVSKAAAAKLVVAASAKGKVKLMIKADVPAAEAPAAEVATA
jgi:hypothetical protein